MSTVRRYLAFWLLHVMSIHYGQCCGPAEIGTQYTITSTATVTIDVRVVWQMDVNNGAIVLYDETSESDPNLYPDQYLCTRTQLTIKNVTKNDGIKVFRRLTNGYSEGYTCKLSVYKKASIPKCEPIALIGNQIRTKCTTAEVFPQAKCQFTLQNGGTDSKVTTSGSYITYNNTQLHSEGDENYSWQQESFTYYSTSCTLEYPVDGLKPGNWTARVNMYPDLTGVSLAQGMFGHAANTLTLSVPTVIIDRMNCPKGLDGEGNTNVRQGYIRQGERASCKCKPAHAGNPPGTIGWSSTQGGSFVVLSQNDDEATIQINSPDTFTCQSASVLNGSHSMTYKPSYAYGPSSASLTFQSPGPIYVCPKQQTNILITCKVPANSLRPATLFTIRDSSSNNLVTKVAGETARSKSVNYNFTESGQHTFTCQVENAIFSDIFSEALASAIEVYAPPNSLPSFQVTGQYVNTTDSLEIWVKQGSDIAVTCYAGEAYPLVSSMTVRCGQETSSSGILSVSGVSGDELFCHCAVNHETKTPCNGINLNNTVIIKTAYGPSGVTVSLTDDQLREMPNRPLSICRAEDHHLTVVCAVKQSDVRPGLTINDFTMTNPDTIATKQMYLDTSKGKYTLVNKLTINSGGSHTLICETRNPKLQDIKQTQSLTIEVYKPPSTKPVVSAWSRQNGDVFVNGDDVTITCFVYGGYPAVQSVTLTCGQNHSVTRNGTSTELILNKIGPKNSLINCICQATHVTGCYDLMGFLNLKILSVNPNKAEDGTSSMTTAEITGTAIGSIVGVLVLVAVIALIVFLVRRAKEKSRNRTKDTEYDKVRRQAPLPYQNVKPLDPTYQTVNPAERTPNSRSANQETERTYNNQVFGEYEEPNEPDPNVYSDIQDN